MNSSDDNLFDGIFLNNETSDDDNPDNEKDDEDEFFDALTESHNIKRKNEQSKSVSTDNLSFSSLGELTKIKNEQLEKFKKRENNSNQEFTDPQLNKDEIVTKSLMNKKLREELIQMRNLNVSETNSPINDDTSSFKTNRALYSSVEFQLKSDFDSDLDSDSKKFKTWPANNNNNNSNVQNILNSIHETQNTASHLHTTNDQKFKSYDTMRLASGSIGTSQDTDKQTSIAYSIQSADEFISPVDKQIAAIFRMSSSNSSQNNNETFGISESINKKSTNKRHTIGYFGDEVNFNIDNDEDEEFDEDDIDKIEIQSLCENSFKRINNKNTTSDNISIDNNTNLNNKSKTRESIRRVFNKFGKVVKQVQNKAEEIINSDQVSDSDSNDDTSTNNNETNKLIKFKAARSNKSTHEFANSQIIQVLNSNNSTYNPVNNQNTSTNQQTATVNNSIIWAMKFSSCGKLLASAGKDQIIRIWVLKSYYDYFNEQITRQNNSESSKYPEDSNISFKRNASTNASIGLSEEQTPFYSKPLLMFSGHTSDILDVSWSKNLFIISSSSDKTCRLWHIYKKECLCTFYHSSIVSAISFHPKDDRYFVSACLDGKLRLWNIAEKKIALWNDLNTNNLNKNKHSFITAISFCQAGRTIAVGTFDGKCILYHTEQLKYYSLINVRSTRGRNKRGSKITGIEVLNTDENKLLITSNDSRIRLYDLRDLSLACKYKGFSNSTVHIKASLSHDDSFIISGSKNKCTYIWRTNYNFSMLNSGRRDRNMYWERLQAHNAIVTCALFHPKPQLVLEQIYKKQADELSSNNLNSKKIDKKIMSGHVFASCAGCDGRILIFVNKLNL